MRAAVLGRPVSHSLSPLLHRAAYAALGLTDWTYDALDVGAEDLPVLLAGLGEEWRGFSVTMPCKQAAVDVADAVEPLPRLLHAANTLVRTATGWRAENTDVTGIGMALQLAGVEKVGAATIIGAGGTAAATAVALSSLGAEQVDVVVRDVARAGDVTRVLDVLGVPVTVTRLDDAALESRLVVSTVPVDAQPALLGLPWRGDHTVLDVLYAPWPTPLASLVAGAGGTVAGGLDVLFWQATVQVELMTGHPAPIEAMRAALDAAVPPPDPVELSRPLLSGAAVLVAVVLGPWLAGLSVRLAFPDRADRPTVLRGVVTTVLFAALLGGAVLLTGARPATFALAWAAGAGVVLGAVDLLCHRLPDRVTWPAYAVCAAALVADAVVLGSWPALVRAVAAGAVAFGVAAGAAAISPAGLGFGDVKLLGLLGLLLGWFGWGVLMAGVFLGSTGALVSLVLLATRRAGWRTALPFGPPLLAGAVLALALGAASIG